ncbi:MAG TPA: 5'-nucleotidase C-terminal domain-containing protein [Gemmatimonadales bacterium]|nr:5'-nucleotidase C-terminal domain-containing protein [Gemmatimonadales bacterium]
MLSLLTIWALTTAVQDTAHLVVVATTDVHGHATDWNYETNQPGPGGLSRVATIVDSLKARYPGQVIVVDAGDAIQGDPFATYFARVAPRDPNPVIEAMNLTGYDVATPGNHEFDWGLAAMRKFFAGAAFPYVSGNLYTMPADTLLYPAYAVLQRQGVRVGVAGFTTPGAMVWNRDQLHGKVRIGRIPEAGARVMGLLAKESDFSIVLVHSGISGASSYDTTGVGAENAATSLARLARPPDLVVVGHSHREIRDTVLDGVHFVQPKPYGGSVSVTHVRLTRSDEGWKQVSIRGELISTAGVTASARLAQRLATAHDAVLQWSDSTIGEAHGTMRAASARMEPTPIINFVNRVQLDRTGADLSAASAFDLRAGFDSGAIRIRDLLALYPYENTLRVIRITGAQLKAYLEHSARYFKVDPVGRISINDSMPGYDFDIVAGARYEMDLRRAVGDRIRNLTVRGRPIDQSKSYTLALNSHRQTGAGGYGMLRGAQVVYDKSENIRDLLVQEIRVRKTIAPSDYASRDWRLVPEAAASAVRNLFKMPRAPLPQSPRDTILLRILATTDLHGALLPHLREHSAGVFSGGAAELSSTMDTLAAECRCPTLRLDAGDAMHGTVASNVTRGRAMVEVLNRLGTVATALADHDLEWSLDTLRRRMSEARFTWLAANVFDSVTGKRPDWIVPYRMFAVGGLTVAVVGYISADTKTAIKGELTRGLRFGEGALTIHDVLTEVRAQKPDVTVLLAHAGATCVNAACTGEVIRLAEAVEGRTVDLILAGHTHEAVNTRVAGIAIVQAGSEGTSLALADIVKTSGGGREVRTRIEPVSPDQVAPDQRMAALVESYRKRTDSIASRVVASIKLPLTRAGSQHRLGAMIAEARRNVLRADVGLVGNASIRADLLAGPVTYGQLFEIQPSQANLVKVTVTGAQLREVLEHALGENGIPSAHVSGVSVRYDPRRRAGRRIQSVELQRGQKLQSGRTYTLAVDDLLASGGGGYLMLSGLPSEPGGGDLDGLVAYLRRLPQPVEVSVPIGFQSTR